MFDGAAADQLISQAAYAREAEISRQTVGELVRAGNTSTRRARKLIKRWCHHYNTVRPRL